MFETERLRIRQFRITDVSRMAGFLNDKEVVKYTERIPHPYEYKDAREFVKKAQDEFGKVKYNYAIELKEEGIVGGIGVGKLFRKRGELGYWLGRPHWGKGIMTEAVKLLLRSQSKDFNLLVSRVSVENIGSQRVLEKCRFKRVGIIPNEHRNVFGEVTDTFQYYWQH